MKISIIGCGNIGMIYAKAFHKYNIVSKEDLFLVEKNNQRKKALEKEKWGRVGNINSKEISECDIILLAVKPQDFGSIQSELKNSLSKKNILLSVMAGITINRLQKELNHKIILRAMPNSPIELGMGMTGFCSSKETSTEQVRKAEYLLSTTGRTVFFEDENRMNAVTALSGSGPAYFFYFVKQLIEAGKKMGFDESVSSLLVKQTMLGAFHQMNSSTKSLDELISTVASKGGTTEAALAQFEKMEMPKAVISGLLNAEKRGKELAGK